MPVLSVALSLVRSVVRLAAPGLLVLLRLLVLAPSLQAHLLL